MLQKKICSFSGKEFVVRNEDTILLDKISPVIAGRKYSIPVSTLSPNERLKKRLARRNEKYLYKRECDATGKSIVSTYSSDKKIPIYDQKVRWSDKWDALEYGQNFDFNRSFFEQFFLLQEQVPHMSIMVSHCENCSYAPFSFQSKNGYMCVSFVDSEDGFYSYQAIHSHDVVDCSLIYYCEECYECLYGIHLYNCYWTNNCKYSKYLYLCDDCENCDHCIGCKGLHDMSYCIFNQKVSLEEFTLAQKEILVNQEKFLSKYEQLQDIKDDTYLINCDNCVGNHLQNCKNSYYCFEAENLEDCAYCFPLPSGAKDCSDINYSPGAERVYDSLSACNAKNSGFLLYSWDVERCWYVDECYYSKDLFGCVGLKHKQYCIFNKQYTKEEYEILVPKIIEHMKSYQERGNFFPMQYSHYSYNESIAQDFFPQTKKYIQQQGLQRYDDTVQIEVFDKTSLVYAKDMLYCYDDTILQQIFVCESSGKPYRIIKQELEFYKKHHLPLPRFHYHVRQNKRLKKRNIYFLEQEF